MTKKIITITAPEGAMYLSQFMDELPIGLLNKVNTGCGATSVVLENNQNTILCCPTKQLIANKVNQYPMQRCEYEILGVTEGIYKKDIQDYIIKCKRRTQPVKIMVTYDSFHKVKDAIGDDIYEYCIIVDEYQELLDIITYRGKAIINFLNNIKDLPKITYVSATPIPYGYRPTELNGLTEYKIVWGNEERVKPIRKHSYKPYASVVRIIKNHQMGHLLTVKNQTVKEYYFFINSVTAIKNIIENANLSNDEVKVICSDIPINKKTLGNISISNVSNENKTFTFCTKTAFCGADFYSESGLIVIVSDGNNKNTMLDMATDIQQISGRIRNTNNPFKNIIMHIYNNGISVMNKDYFNKSLSENIELANKKIEAYNLLPDDYKEVITADIDDKDELAYYDETDKLLKINELKISNIKYKFAAVDCVYQNGITIKDAYLKNGYDAVEAETYEQVAEKFIEFVTKSESYKELIEEYYSERNKTTLGRTEIAKYIESRIKNITDIYKTLKIEDIRKLGYNRTKMKNLVRSKNEIVKKAISNDLNKEFIVGKRYSNKEAKATIQKIYENLFIKIAPKVTALNEYFEIKKIKIPTEDKRIGGIEIVKVLSVENLKANNDIFLFPKINLECKIPPNSSPLLNLGERISPAITL